MTDGIPLETFNPVVFHDDIFCENDTSGKCRYITTFLECILFIDDNGFYTVLHPKDGKALKCQECLSHYLYAVEKIEMEECNNFLKEEDEHYQRNKNGKC